MCWDAEMSINRWQTPVVRIKGLHVLYIAQHLYHCKDAFYFVLYLIGKAREKLKWADGKAVKAEIDMQVRYYKYMINIQVMYLK